MVARGRESLRREDIPHALKNFLLFVATTSPGAVPLLSQILAVEEHHLIQVNPEQPHPDMEWVDEPKGESKLAVIFKIWRTLTHLLHLEITHGSFIYSADVEVKMNGESKHRPIRDNSEHHDPDEIEAMTKEVIKLYSTKTHIEWHVTLGVAIDNAVRVTTPIVICTDFKALDPETVRRYLHLRSNTGMRSVELGKVLGNTFYICDEKGEKQHEISADKAYKLIVEKVPLNLQMLSELILSEAVHQEHDLLSGLLYYTVAVNL